MSTLMRRLPILLVAGLLVIPPLATANAPASKSGYRVKVRVEMSGGRTTPIYVGDPLRISLHKRYRGMEQFELCWTPAPIEKPRCSRHHRVNGVGVAGSPSKAGLLKLRFKIRQSGRVIVRKIRVLDPPR
jgi:hypothetical protein